MLIAIVGSYRPYRLCEHASSGLVPSPRAECLKEFVSLLNAQGHPRRFQNAPDRSQRSRHRFRHRQSLPPRPAPRVADARVDFGAPGAGDLSAEPRRDRRPGSSPRSGTCEQCPSAALPCEIAAEAERTDPGRLSRGDQISVGLTVTAARCSNDREECEGCRRRPRTLYWRGRLRGMVAICLRTLARSVGWRWLWVWCCRG